LSGLSENPEENLIASALKKTEEDSIKTKLPPLEELLPRIPKSVHESLEELLRAKWSRVVRIKQRHLGKL